MRLKFYFLFFFILAISGYSRAQLCQGSLGDPIVNITFGQGPNPGPSLSAAATNYQYVPNDCPNDGYYTVRNNTSACFGNSWYSFSSDHTGNPNGYFMLVNASIQPSAFYLDTVRGLCGNTTYEFAAWIMNVIFPSSCGGNTIQPNLTFNIERTDGTNLQTYNTGNIPPLSAPTWKQYGFYFTTPVGISDIVLRIVNNSQGGCGNDLALDDITFRPCGPLLMPSIIGITGSSASLCEGTAGSYTFNCSVSGGFNNPVLQWQERINNGAWTDIAGENTVSFSRTFPPNLPAGNIYEYRLAAAEIGNLGSVQCRIVCQPLSVVISPIPVTSATNDGPVCAKTTATLTATGGVQYQWTGPNGFSGTGSPVTVSNIQFNGAGKYYVTVTSAAGCVNTDSSTVAVNPAPLATTSFTNASICIGDSIQLIAGGGLSFNWMPSIGLSDASIFNPKASPSQTTVYSLIVTNQFSCTDTLLITINVIPLANVNAGPDKVILSRQHVQLSGSVIGQNVTNTWSPPQYINDIHSLQPIVNPPSDQQYILTAVSDFGCKTFADTMFVKVYNDIYIPNAFTPNGDGINDTWNIPALAAYPNFELFIYDRYGQMIYQTKIIPVAWNGMYKGKRCLNGVYTYVIKTGYRNETISGSVMLIR